MSLTVQDFITKYTKHSKERASLGIPPLPLSTEEVKTISEALCDPNLDQNLFKLEGCMNTSQSLIWLLDERVPPGVYPASKAKSSFLGDILKKAKTSPYISREDAIRILGHMGGGDAISHLINSLTFEKSLASLGEDILKKFVLINQYEIEAVKNLAEKGNDFAKSLLQGWAQASWFSASPKVPDILTMTVIRTTGEINTDFLSPAKEAGTRDDIPLHALKIFSISPNDKDFIQRITKLKGMGHPILWAGDVVGTGSSRKSASNSTVWWIGEDIPHVPNKRKGGVIMASKIAPIFFNTIRGCGAIPIRCSTGTLQEGMVVKVNFKEGKVLSESGTELVTFAVDPVSILDESRVGGRNFLIIGFHLTQRAMEVCSKLGIKHSAPALKLPEAPKVKDGHSFSLGQKLVGKAIGVKGVLPGSYVEPQAHLVFSQDTTGKMTQQEIQELACTKYATTFIQSFCHTAAAPSSKDSRVQSELTSFVTELGGIALRPGDGIIHTNGNRFLLPYFVGTGGDSHTRFPVGISFPAGSDLVAFAGSQGYFPLDMPESVLVKFKGKTKKGITIRDIVNSIPYTALQQGLLNLEKGDKKKNVFADRILEVQGLEDLTPEEAYKITDTSAERSAAACTFAFKPEKIVSYVENNLRFLEHNFYKRCPIEAVSRVIKSFKDWLKKPEFSTADQGASYAAIMEVDLDKINEPLLAAPNDPDKIVTLSQAAGTPIEEVFIGSCMVDITDLRGLKAILEHELVKYPMKIWVSPPDRETFAQLADEGILSKLTAAGVNIHVPGCSLCMGNQAQVAENAVIFSTSTRNFDNRIGIGAQVYLGSAFVGAIASILGRIPTSEEYFRYFNEKVASKWGDINRTLNHA